MNTPIHIQQNRDTETSGQNTLVSIKKKYKKYKFLRQSLTFILYLIINIKLAGRDSIFTNPVVYSFYLNVVVKKAFKTMAEMLEEL